MRRIGQEWAELESQGANFVVEALADELRAPWITEALRQAARKGQRKRLLPDDFTLWFVILMGLFRRTSYANLLEKLDGSLWTGGHWSPHQPPTTSAVTKARDRLGVKPVQHLWQRSSGEWVRSSPGLIFHGHRVKALDG